MVWERSQLTSRCSRQISKQLELSTFPSPIYHSIYNLELQQPQGFRLERAGTVPLLALAHLRAQDDHFNRCEINHTCTCTATRTYCYNRLAYIYINPYGASMIGVFRCRQLQMQETRCTNREQMSLLASAALYAQAFGLLYGVAVTHSDS